MLCKLSIVTVLCSGTMMFAGSVVDILSFNEEGSNFFARLASWLFAPSLSDCG